jgi:colicin import membrane protein
MTTDTETTDLIVLPKAEDIPSLYEKDGELLKLVERIEKDVRSHAIDAATDEGRKFATSLASKVSSSKVLIETAGKNMTEEWRKKTAAVNEVRKTAVARLDALRDEVKAPVQKWKDAENERVAAIQKKILTFDTDQLTAASSSSELKALLTRIEELEVTEDVFAEFMMDAEEAKAEALKKFGADLKVAEEREAAEAELAELRAEKARRQEEDEKRAAAEAKAAEEAAAEEARKKADEEREAQRAAEVKRREEEAERKHQEELAAAKREAEEAAERERKRIADEKAAEEARQEKARQDAKRRKVVIAEAMEDMRKIEDRTMEGLLGAMIDGRIRHFGARL